MATMLSYSAVPFSTGWQVMPARVMIDFHESSSLLHKRRWRGGRSRGPSGPVPHFFPFGRDVGKDRGGDFFHIRRIGEKGAPTLIRCIPSGKYSNARAVCTRSSYSSPRIVCRDCTATRVNPSSIMVIFSFPWGEGDVFVKQNQSMLNPAPSCGQDFGLRIDLPGFVPMLRPCNG